ncbi:MAG: hypothetical protein MJK04_28380 [Psychrosphaera sp.]|nr:hypothetical protein [Psychrosphaera sp.]
METTQDTGPVVASGDGPDGPAPGGDEPPPPPPVAVIVVKPVPDTTLSSPSAPVCLVVPDF